MKKPHVWNLCSVYQSKLNREWSVYVLFKMVAIENNPTFRRITIFWGLIDIYIEKEKK